MSEARGPTNWLIEKFPYTYDLKWSLYVSAAFAGITAVSFSIGGTRFYSWALAICSAAFLAILLLALVFELISKVVPAFQFLPRLFSAIVKLAGRLYILTFSLFLRPVVEYIVEGKATKDASIILMKVPGEDDTYVEEILNFKELRSTTVKFSTTSTYWRLGIKFSRDENFDGGRLESNCPLFHLAKDEVNNIIYRVYYDENKNRRPNENLIENYDGSPLILDIDKKNGLRIVIKNAQGEVLKSEDFNLELHKFGKIFAWGDGRDYKIKVNIEKRAQ